MATTVSRGTTEATRDFLEGTFKSCNGHHKFCTSYCLSGLQAQYRVKDLPVLPPFWFLLWPGANADSTQGVADVALCRCCNMALLQHPALALETQAQVLRIIRTWPWLPMTKIIIAITIFRTFLLLLKQRIRSLNSRVLWSQWYSALFLHEVVFNYLPSDNQFV